MNEFLNRWIRQKTGAVLTEGIVGMVMLSMTIIGRVAFLVNSGLCTFYKHKVAFVTIEAARYAAQLPDDRDLEGKTRTFANAMLASGFHRQC